VLSSKADAPAASTPGHEIFPGLNHVRPFFQISRPATFSQWEEHFSFYNNNSGRNPLTKGFDTPVKFLPPSFLVYPFSSSRLRCSWRCFEDFLSNDRLPLSPRFSELGIVPSENCGSKLLKPFFDDW